MTELLKDTMRERADGVDRPLVDLDAVMKAGERRRQRRGAIAIVGTAAVCAVVGMGAVQVAGTSDGAEGPSYAHGGAFEERKATYATGSMIHYGDASTDAGTEVRAFVQTDDGFVVMGPKGKVLFTNGESARTIGKANVAGHLAADDSGSYVAWVDTSVDGPPEFVVYDTATGDEAVRTSDGNESGKGARGGGLPRAVDVDGTNLYVRNAEGFARIDIPSGRTELLRAGADNESEIVAVENGQRLRRVHTGNPDEGESDSTGPVMRRSGRADGLLVVAGGRDLSPDAHYVTSDANDSEQIFDARTGAEVVLDTGPYGFQAVSQWLDDDTAAVAVLKDPDARNLDISMLTCDVPSGECDVAADGLSTDITLPTGGDPRP